MQMACDSFSIRIPMRIATNASGWRAKYETASMTPHAMHLAMYKIVCFMFSVLVSSDGFSHPRWNNYPRERFYRLRERLT